MAAPRRRPAARPLYLDRSLEALPVFRLSDSGEDGAIEYALEGGARWRVLPAPGDRVPGTFDQDVYVELLRRFQDAGEPADGAIRFTLHAFLRGMGRRVDGRTYEQLRGALVRLERTTLESTDAYESAARGPVRASFSILSAVSIERRRVADRDQFALFPTVSASEPGEARVVIALPLRENIAARFSTTLVSARYWSLASPVARRLYRLLEVARSGDTMAWRVSLDQLREQLPLAQRFPSHLQRVLQPAHAMLVDAGLVRSATFRQEQKEWLVDYVLGMRGGRPE
ncbi:MAG: hypothetical protein JWO05_1722 [Gemmatimonadetes bacterium]|nr:hypothetical protein [Gemmatimonadota bacterium]